MREKSWRCDGNFKTGRFHVALPHAGPWGVQKRYDEIDGKSTQPPRWLLKRPTSEIRWEYEIEKNAVRYFERKSAKNKIPIKSIDNNYDWPRPQIQYWVEREK